MRVHISQAILLKIHKLFKVTYYKYSKNWQRSSSNFKIYLLGYYDTLKHNSNLFYIHTNTLRSTFSNQI